VSAIACVLFFFPSSWAGAAVVDERGKKKKNTGEVKKFSPCSKEEQRFLLFFVREWFARLCSPLGGPQWARGGSFAGELVGWLSGLQACLSKLGLVHML